MEEMAWEESEAMRWLLIFVNLSEAYLRGMR